MTERESRPQAANPGAAEISADNQIGTSLLPDADHAAHLDAIRAGSPEEATAVSERLTEAEAKHLTMRIRLRLDTIADNYVAVMPMIREAVDGQAHVALGYRSPGAYVVDRFGGALSRVGVDVRREVVRELTEAGMSTRAIAPVVGASVGTVHSDRQVFNTEHPPTPPAGDTPGVASDRTVTGLDGKTFTFKQRAAGRDDGTATAPKASPRLGPRRRHLQVIDSIAASLNGAAIAAGDIAGVGMLDDSVTREEAARLAGDLSRSIQSLNRVRNLLKVVSGGEV